MFEQTTEQVIRTLGSIQKTESVMVAVGSQLGKVVPASDGLKLYDLAVQTIVTSEKLDPAQVNCVRGILMLETPPATDIITELKFTSGIDPREVASIKELYRNEPSLECQLPTDRKERLVGVLFRILDKQGMRITWKETEEIFDRNCVLELKSNDDYKKLNLSGLGRGLYSAVDKFVAEGSQIVDSVLSTRAQVPILKRLNEKFKPGCVERKSTLADAGANSLLDAKSHIVRQPVTITFGAELSSEGILKINRPKINIADRNFGEIYPSMSHELFELGINQHFLNKCADPAIPASFIVQFLAEKMVMDTLVWTSQVKTMPTLTKAEKVAILDRAFTIQLSMTPSIDSLARLAGKDHPFVEELQFYDQGFRALLSKHDPNSFRAVVKEPDERTPREQATYADFLVQFYQTYLSAIPVIGAQKNYILVNPEKILFQD